MIRPTLIGTALAAVLASCTATHAAVMNPVEDVMTSGFFFAPNLVRGFAADNRPTLRVSNDAPFGVAPETTYISFDAAEFAGFAGPILSATLTVESVTGMFGADAGPMNPFTVSAHGVTADPISSITDDTDPSGPIGFFDFFNNNILPNDPAAVTVINGFGAFEFDVTALVNDWISGVTADTTIALTGMNDTSGNDFLHGFLDNSLAPGSTFLTATVPEPSSFLLIVLGGCVLAWWIAHPSREGHGIV
ncbi:MAG: hypothetical protein AAF790_02080 [Planctomycetota bacterium]